MGEGSCWRDARAQSGSERRKHKPDSPSAWPTTPQVSSSCIPSGVRSGGIRRCLPWPAEPEPVGPPRVRQGIDLSKSKINSRARESRTLRRSRTSGVTLAVGPVISVPYELVLSSVSSADWPPSALIVQWRLVTCHSSVYPPFGVQEMVSPRAGTICRSISSSAPGKDIVTCMVEPFVEWSLVLGRGGCLVVM